MASPLPKSMRCIVAKEGSIEEQERPVPHPEGRKVLIKIYASALNRADLMQVQGEYHGPTDVLGLECAGKVIAIGGDCEFGWVQGDRVSSLLGGGGYAEYVAVDERQVLRVPDDESFEDAAAIPEVWLTAFQHFRYVAKAQPNDSILIHAGASGVGTAAIQLARHVFGLTKIFVTAGTQEKIDFCKSLGATEGFNYKTDDWAQCVLDATGGNGVSIIHDPVGYPYVKGNTKAIAVDGRWIFFGFLGGIPKDGTMPALFEEVLHKRIQLLGTTLRSRSLEYKAELCKTFVENTFDKFASKVLKPVRDKRCFHGIESFGLAHEYMESNVSIGKIIVTIV